MPAHCGHDLKSSHHQKKTEGLLLHPPQTEGTHRGDSRMLQHVTHDTTNRNQLDDRLEPQPPAHQEISPEAGRSCPTNMTSYRTAAGSTLEEEGQLKFHRPSPPWCYSHILKKKKKKEKRVLPCFVFFPLPLPLKVLFRMQLEI